MLGGDHRKWLAMCSFLGRAGAHFCKADLTLGALFTKPVFGTTLQTVVREFVAACFVKARGLLHAPSATRVFFAADFVYLDASRVSQKRIELVQALSC